METSNIIQLPIRDAMREKHKEGVDEYRGGNEETPFIGDPLEEMYSEFIDSLNYNNIAKLQGWPFHEEFERIITNLAETIKEYKDINI